jgi:gluconokinase
VHLHGDAALIAERMRKRSGHFMPVALLDSQLRDLEPLQPDEQGMRLNITDPPEQLVDRLLQSYANDGVRLSNAS